MTRARKPAFWIPLVLTAVLLGGAFRIQDEIMHRRRREPLRFRYSLYLPDSRYVQFVSLGYGHFMADFLWLRMIQSFASGWSRPEDKQQIKSYFDVITDLDPHYLAAYDFATMAIGEGATTPGFYNRMIIDTIDKSTVYNPRDWYIPYEGAYSAWWEMDNADLAKYYTRIAMKDPSHPAYIERIFNYIEIQTGRYRFAYEKIMADLARAQVSDDEYIQAIHWRHLERAVNLWIISEIKSRAVEWRKTHDAYPSIEQLEAAGSFQDAEMPDWTLIRQGFEQARVRGVDLSADPAGLRQFIDGCLRRWNRVPPSPHDHYNANFQGYVIWGDMASNDKLFILSKAQAIGRIKGILVDIRNDAVVYKARHNDTVPTDLAEFSPSFASISDPFGGKWTWNPATETAGCTSVPNANQIQIPEL